MYDIRAVTGLIDRLVEGEVTKINGGGVVQRVAGTQCILKLQTPNVVNVRENKVMGVGPWMGCSCRYSKYTKIREREPTTDAELRGNGIK